MVEAAKIYPVVMCGGSGTRLWPLSRKSYPKQFNRLFVGGSLFQRTLERITGAGYADPIILTHQDFRFIAAEQLSDIGSTDHIHAAPDTSTVNSHQHRHAGILQSVKSRL